MSKAWERGRNVLLRLDTWNAEFVGHKGILQKIEDKEETKKDSVYALENPYQRKHMLKRQKMWAHYNEN